VDKVDGHPHYRGSRFYGEAKCDQEGCWSKGTLRWSEQRVLCDVHFVSATSRKLNEVSGQCDVVLTNPVA